MLSKKWKKEIITVPNLLSIFRMILIPVYISIYLRATNDRQFLLAGSVLGLSCLTDMADGVIARRFHRITNVGKILDPLADKLTQLALILTLSTKYTVLYPLLALFLIKELFQLSAFGIFAQKGKVLAGALPAGKICTTVLFLSLMILVLFPRLPRNMVIWLTVMDTVFLFFAFDSYLLAYFGKRNQLTDWKKSER